MLSVSDGRDHPVATDSSIKRKRVKLKWRSKFVIARCDAPDYLGFKSTVISSAEGSGQKESALMLIQNSPHLYRFDARTADP